MSGVVSTAVSSYLLSSNSSSNEEPYVQVFSELESVGLILGLLIIIVVFILSYLFIQWIDDKCYFAYDKGFLTYIKTRIKDFFSNNI